MAALLFISGLTVNVSTAGSEKSFTAISIRKDDRILILAPHPDDEIIGCAGIIQESLRKGAKLKILYLTEGENNLMALIVYKKKLLFKNRISELIALGNIRKQESTEAAESLGIGKDSLIFLDYPDSGTRTIFTDHWGRDNEFTDPLTGLSQNEDGEGTTPNASYLGEAILADIENAIGEFKPTKIFCSHPLDQHSDHIALYLFLKTGLLELREGIEKPKIYLYIVHHRHWPRPYGFRPDGTLFPPRILTNLGLNWSIFKLSPAEVEGKKQALMKFKSQLGYSRNYLLSFVRSNELFSDDLTAGNIFKGESGLKRTSFYRGNDSLKIDIELSKRVPNPRDIKGTFYLFGYSNKKPFKDMPKIKIGLRADRYSIYNMGRRISKAGVNLEIRPYAVHLRIPLSMLDDPDSLFYSFKSNLTGTQTIRWGYWRVIDLKR